MHVVKQSFADRPEDIASEAYDLVWIRCPDLGADTPAKSESVQWLDWKLQGQIHRWSLQKTRGLTYLPTFGKVASPMLSLDAHSQFSLEGLEKACAGLKVKQVLVFCKDASEVNHIEKEVRHHKFGAPLERVVVGSDEVVGRV